MSHLTEEQLVRIRDLEEDEAEARTHLASCPKCQRALSQARRDRALLGSPTRAEKHLSRDRILAFRDNALSPSSTLTVQQHLDECNRCLASYDRLGQVDDSLEYPSPPAATIRRIQRRFRPSPLRDLGVLVLRRLKDSLGLRYVARKAPNTFATRSHPASASARSRRIGNQHAKPDLLPFRPSRVTEVRAGDLVLLIQAQEAAGTPVLRIGVVSETTGKPARGVSLRLRAESGRTVETRTDPRGNAEIAFPDGQSTLEIGDNEPLLLRMRG